MSSVVETRIEKTIPWAEREVRKEASLGEPRRGMISELASVERKEDWRVRP